MFVAEGKGFAGKLNIIVFSAGSDWQGEAGSSLGEM